METTAAVLREYGPHIAFLLTVVTAIVLDVIIARMLLDLVRPPSAYVFRVARVSKIAAFIAWLVMFHTWWYPEFVGRGFPPPQWVGALEGGAVAAAIMFALTTVPRPSRSREVNRG